MTINLQALQRLNGMKEQVEDIIAKARAAAQESLDSLERQRTIIESSIAMDVSFQLEDRNLPTLEVIEKDIAAEKELIKATAEKIIGAEGFKGSTVKGDYADVTLVKTRKAQVADGQELAVIRAFAAAGQYAALKLQSSTKLIKALDHMQANGVELPVGEDQVTIVEDTGLRIKVHQSN